MRRSLLFAMVALACLGMSPPASAAFSRCMFFSGTADALVKPNAVEESLEALREAIDKYKAENGVSGPGKRDRRETEAASLLAERDLAASVPAARYGVRLCLHALLEGRGVAGRLHFRRQALLVRHV